MLNKFKILQFEESWLSLRISCKDLHKRDFHNRIEEDDIVIIKNSAKSRPFWKLGRALELFRDSNNRIHSASIKREDGIIDSHCGCCQGSFWQNQQITPTSDLVTFSKITRKTK